MADITKTVKPSGGDYTALETCLNANEQDLTSTAGIFNVEIDGTWSADDTIKVLIDGWTTSATYYINIYATSAAACKGLAGTGYVLAPTGSGHVVTLDELHTRMSGFEIELVATIAASDECIRCDGECDGLILDKMLIHTDAAFISDTDGVYFYNKNGMTDPATSRTS